MADLRQKPSYNDWEYILYFRAPNCVKYIHGIHTLPSFFFFFWGGGGGGGGGAEIKTCTSYGRVLGL